MPPGVCERGLGMRRGERLDRVAMEAERLRWTREGVMLERRRRREWERDFMVLVVTLIVGLLLVVAVVGRHGVPWRYGGALPDGELEARYLVENWGRGWYGDELGEWE